MEYLHSELTKEIVGAFYDVYNTLGFGFLEKAYENALAIELRNWSYAPVPYFGVNKRNFA